MACNLNGKHSEETQEHIFLCENLSKNYSTLKISKEMFSEIFTIEWDTENIKQIVNNFMKNIKAKEKMENGNKSET